MTRMCAIAGLSLASLLCIGHESQAQRGRGGFGGARGGVMSPAGGYGGRAVSPSVGVYSGGAGSSTRTSTPVVGPGGRSGTVHHGSGSYTTQRGTTVEYKGAGVTGTTPGGVNVGRGAGAVQVTTASGKTVTSAGRAAGAVGPGGSAVGGRSGVTYGTGPGGGSFSTAYRGGVAVGPYGAVAGGARVATTPAGGTYYRSATAVRGQAVTVRQNFYSFAQEYPALTVRWAGPTWRPVAWSVLAATASYPAEPTYYDYGETVVYSGDTVTVNGETEVPAEQYAQQATDIATVGKEAKVEPKADDFQPLGVFAMVKGNETTSSNIFQLAVNKDGVIRGEYYNALTDTTDPVYGSVDKKTQRAAWTVADRKTPVYEAGIANLTKDETTMLVHFGKTKSQQFALIRIDQPKTGADGK